MSRLYLIGHIIRFYMKNNKNRGKLFLALIISVLILSVLSNHEGNSADLPAYFVANQHYKAGKFQDAIDSYFRALKDNPGLLYKEPLVRFKIGYGFYQTRDYQKSLDIFQTGTKSLDIIVDYLYYFQIISQLNVGDTSSAIQSQQRLRLEFPDSPTIPLLDSLQAVNSLQNNLPDSARKYLNAMSKSGYFDRDKIDLQLISVLASLKDTSDYRRTAYRFLKKYPFHDQAEDIFRQLTGTYQQKIPFRELKMLFKYLFATKQFLAAAGLLENQEIFAQSLFKQEYFKWLPQEMLFRQGEYGKVLQWCLENRKLFKYPRVRRNIDLTIARCYLRRGDVKQSIKYYLEFQKRYPRDQLSPEVLWKVAWLYENQKNVKKAIDIYRRLIKKYPRSSFFDEAYFRIGLDLYREGKYKNARDAWKKAYRRAKKSSQKARIYYWIGKCYEKERNYTRQGEIFNDLAQKPIDSFYNLKAFYLTSNGQDTHQRIKEAFWELHQQNISYLATYIEQFNRVLLVEEILGRRWADREIRSMQEKSDQWQEVFALGELYERMHNFGFAYRRFRSVFNREFIQSDFTGMIPVFKKLYPLYYSEEVDSAADYFTIPPELIWSVMKKESAFAPKVISYANAYGLMQLLPGTASQIAPKLGMAFTSTEQLFDPKTNIFMGSYYLSSLLNKYDGNYIMALAGYNAGPHRVDRWKRNYPVSDDDLFMENLEFEQTRVYVRTCLKYFWIYQAITRPGEIPLEIISYPIQLSDYL